MTSQLDLADQIVGPAEQDTIVSLVAHMTTPRTNMQLLPADARRQWMNDTPERFAHRCLPLLIANQSGWVITNPEPISVTWDGTPAKEGITIEALDAQLPSVSSHFGDAILTWSLPYVFRTSPGYNLLVRGPANWPKDGISALEGVVETDWLEATFTMNWKLTRPHLKVVFERDEPICMVVPQRRGELESVVPRLRRLDQTPALAEAYNQWSDGRIRFYRQLHQPGSDAQARGWERTYMLGIQQDGSQAPTHQTRLRLQSFASDNGCD
jgi:hypothetical protein